MKQQNAKPSVWIIIGAVVLIILLLLWLTFAEASGDDDVNANFAQILANYINFA